MSKKVKLEGGANNVTLKSGDEGFYIDLTIKDLQKLQEEYLRELPCEKQGVRVFITPTQLERTYYKYYLTAAEANNH